MNFLTCPNCGGQMEITEQRELAFCMYCGTKITNINNSIEINKTKEINNLIIRALEFEQKGNYKLAEDYCMRILDIEPSNKTARALEKRLPSYTPLPNIEITYNSKLSDIYKLRITLDGRKWNILSNGETLKLTLPVGKHKILFSGTKIYSYEINIENLDKQIKIIYTAKPGNCNFIDEY